MKRLWHHRPLWAATLLLSIAWIAQTLFVTPPDGAPVNHFPPGSVAAGGTPGNAAFGGRPIPVSLVLLRRVTPPQPAVDVDYNWPPIPGIELRVQVGRRDEQDRLIPDPSMGFVSATRATTDTNGQILVDYIPPGPDTRPEAREPLHAVLWFSDEAKRAVPFEIRLWRRMETDRVAPPPLDLKVSTTSFDSYRNGINDGSLRRLFELAVDRWNELSGSAAGDRLLRSEGNGRTFFVRANQPTAPADRLRSAYAIAEFGMGGALGITLHTERVAPNTRFSPLPATGVTGMENIGRSFQSPMPDDAVLGTFGHELGHLLGLGETTDINSQASIMCLGRGQVLGDNFRFFVNGVTSPTQRDRSAVYAIRSRAAKHILRKEFHTANSHDPFAAGRVLPPTTWWLALEERTNLVRFSTSQALPTILEAARSGPGAPMPPLGIPAWAATFCVRGEVHHCRIWPEQDVLSLDEIDGSAAVRRIRGVGRQLLRTLPLDRTADSRTQSPTRPVLLDRQEDNRLPSLQSLRNRTPTAVAGVVIDGALVPAKTGEIPLAFIQVEQVLWGDDIRPNQILAVRWPWGVGAYGDQELPLPNPGSRIAISLTPESFVVDGRVTQSGFYVLAMPQPFGVVRLENGLTAPYSTFGGAAKRGRTSHVPGFLLPRPIALFGQPTDAFLNLLSHYGRADQPWGTVGGLAGNLDRVLVGLGE